MFSPTQCPEQELTFVPDSLSSLNFTDLLVVTHNLSDTGDKTSNSPDPLPACYVSSQDLSSNLQPLVAVALGSPTWDGSFPI